MEPSDVSAFDFQPDETRRAFALGRFIDIYEHARQNSPHYRVKYGGRSVRSWPDVRAVPLLTPDEMKDHSGPLGGDLLTGPPTATWLFCTGGTTGRPKVSYREIEEQRRLAAGIAKGLRLKLFRPHDRVANLLAAGSMYASFVTFSMVLEAVGCQILPISFNVPVEQMVHYLRTFRATGAVAFPSVMLALAEYVEARRITDLRLERIAVGGEHLYDHARRYLREVLGAEVIASTGYLAIDVGAIGFQCEFCEGSIHHVLEGLQLVEVLDPECGQAVPDGEEGNLVVTNLHRKLLPVIRYRLGDRGRLLPQRCPCGRTVRLLELLGRSDDGLIIGAAKVVPEVVDEAVSGFPELSHHFQMVARTAGHLDELTVAVERSPGADAAVTPSLVEPLRQAIYARCKELALLRESRRIAEVRVDIVPPGALPRNPRTGKLRVARDEREMQ